MNLERFDRAKSAVYQFTSVARKGITNRVKESFEAKPDKLNLTEELMLEAYMLGTLAWPPSPVLGDMWKLYNYVSTYSKVRDGKPQSIKLEEKAKGIFEQYLGLSEYLGPDGKKETGLGHYKELGNVQGLENIPLDRPFVFASNHWNGNPFKLDPRLVLEGQETTPLRHSFVHDPLKGFWQVPVIEHIIRDTVPTEPHRRIRFIIEVRKYILDDLQKKLSKLTRGRSESILPWVSAAIPDLYRELWKANGEIIRQDIYKKIEHIMANMAKSMDFISKETGTREVIETIRKKHDILGVFPSGEAEYEVKRGLPEAGKVFERAAEVDKKNPAAPPTEVLPIACWFDGQRIQIRIGKPMLCPETKGDKESAQKTVDKVMIAIGSMLPEDMWGAYAEEIRQLKEQREPTLVFSTH